MSDSDVFEKLVEIQRSGQRAVLATVVEAVGSTPREAGARMLVLPDGTTHGTVGGGALEHHVNGLAAEVLRMGEPRLVPLHLANDLGMSCGGRVTVFLEPIGAEDRLYLFGAGHIATHICEMAGRCGFSVIVCDDRAELLTSDRFPQAARLFPAAEPQRLEELELRAHAANAYVMVVTHTHELDFGLVRAVAPLRPAYLGMIGSRRKRSALDAYLGEAGFPEDVVRAIRCPAGLELGGSTPAEIAMSIVAQLVALRAERRAARIAPVADPAPVE
ncbi:MAG: XdhC/CoxI family protein [bacterium]